ncbi:Calmodulin-like protein 3 [Exaiptasia diaphana]|nr:Calmodulin-like protein 3 [Exaiptasia diaphana]
MRNYAWSNSVRDSNIARNVVGVVYCCKMVFQVGTMRKVNLSLVIMFLKSADSENHLQSIPSSSGSQSLGVDNRGLDGACFDNRGLEDSETEFNPDQPVLSFSRLSHSLETRRLSKLAEKDHWFTPPTERRNKAIPTRRATTTKERSDSTSTTKTYSKQGKRCSDYDTVEIKRGIQDELGFKIEGGLDKPCYPGDPGIFVNDINISRVTREHAKDIIANATGSVVALYVKRATQRQQMIESALSSDRNGQTCFFTKEQVEEFEDAFSMFNKDQTGLIKTTKVFSLIRSLGHNPAEHAVWVFLNDLGLTANCRLSFQDFVDLMTVIVSEQSPEYETSSASNVFDTDERGFVTVQELYEAFERMPGRERMKDYELNEIIGRADPAGRGIIKLNDFENLLQPSLTLY